MGLKHILFAAAHVAVQAFAAANSSDASTFVFRSSSTDQTFVFALNAVKATGDLFFHLEAPAGQAWAAVGIGSEMEDSLIFAAYASENGTGVTVSPRIATRHSEPSYAKDVDLQQIWPSGINGSNTIGADGRLRADAVCRNCTSWLSGDGNLDLTNTAAPFIFAVGPSKELRSSSLTASMRRHDFYGHFTMNMTAATSSEEGTVPPPNSKNGTYELHAASEAKDMTADSSHAPAAHALIMLGSFVFLFPLGSLVLKVLHKALWHGIVQILAVVLITVGFGLGISLSTQYNKVCRAHPSKANDHSNETTNQNQSKSFLSAHQIIGLLIFVALLIQLGLGLLHHRTYKQTKSPTTFSKIHRYLGPAVFLLGVINGGLGFNFAGNSSYNARYAVVVLAVAVIYFGVRGTAWWWTKRNGGKGEQKQQQQQWIGDDGYRQHERSGHQEPYGQAIPLREFPGRA
jgi:cytochrome b